MKKILLYALAIFLTGGMISSCSEDKLGDSIFDTNPPARTEFDNWLLRNYVKEYNIDFKYRLEDIEANMSGRSREIQETGKDHQISVARIIRRDVRQDRSKQGFHADLRS